MPIQQSKQQSDLEKRLHLLRRQVYGKETKTGKSAEKTISYQPGKLLNNPIAISDLKFLHQDLLKIGIFSSVAIGLQIILFFLMQNNLLNLKLF